MRYRVSCIVLLVAILTISGCSNVLEERTQTPTVTPAEVPTVAATETPEPDLAPGLSRAGITDAADLVTAHQRVLNGRSYTVASNITERFHGGRLRRLKLACAQYETEGEYYITATFDGTALPRVPDRTGIWSDGERTGRITIPDGETAVINTTGIDLLDARTRYALATTETNNLRTLFVSIERSRVSPINEKTGPERYRITATAFSRPSLSAIRPIETTETATFRAVVDSRGLVHSYRLTYTGAIGNQTVTGIETVQYMNVNSTTVERPSWATRSTNENQSGAANSKRTGRLVNQCGGSSSS